jgi:hypothetical protein
MFFRNLNQSLPCKISYAGVFEIVRILLPTEIQQTLTLSEPSHWKVKNVGKEKKARVK